MKSITRRRLLSLAAMAASASTLAGCSDGDTNRQFANQPIPTEDLVNGGLTPSGATTRIARPAGTAVAPETLLASRGSSPRLFLVAGESVVAVDVSNGASNVILESKDATIVGVSGAPAGDRVALLIHSGKEHEETLRVIDFAGADQRDAVRMGTIAGSPVAPRGEPSPSRRRLAWSADGKTIAVTLEDGGLAEVGESGQPRVLVTRRQAPQPNAVAWSPRGDAIAFSAVGSGGVAPELFVASTLSLPADPVAMLTGKRAARGQIVDLIWAQDAAGILFLDEGSDPAAKSGNIYAASPSGEGSRLFVSAGFAAPVASIVAFTLSTIGSTLAMVVETPGDRASSVHSIWLKDSGTSTTIRVGMPAGERVLDLWWTTAGLIWRGNGRSDATPAPSTGAIQLYRVNDKGESVELTRTGAFAATPVASPAGSPSSSPVGTP